jgi:O-antigen ligase
MNLQNGFCYFAVFALSFWCLAQRLPGLGLTAAEIVGGTLATAGLPLLLRGRLYLRHSPIFLVFVLIHLTIINPDHLGHSALHLGGQVLFAFASAVIFVNLAGGLKVYSGMISIMIATTASIALLLTYLHLFEFGSGYLTPHLDYETYYSVGRYGKNTLGFFLAFLFPFAYSRFSHKRTLLSLVGLSLITFSALYTISRMILLSLVLSIFLFAIFSTRRKIFLRQLMIVAVISLILFPVLLEIDLVETFLKLRSPATVEAVEDGEITFFDFGGHRMRMIREGLEGFWSSPLFGHGIGSFRVGGRSQAHNDYIQILYEFGLLGFLLFIAIFLMSFKDLLAGKKAIPPRYQWLWDAQIVCLVSVFFSLLFISAYETLPVWFTLAGTQIVTRSARRSEALQGGRIQLKTPEYAH